MSQINISSILRVAALLCTRKIAKNIEEDVFSFLKENPNPSDSQVHSFAEKNNYDIHDFEKEIYKLASAFVSFMSNGLATEKKITEKDVDKKQLKKGIKVEKEHIKKDSSFQETIHKKIALKIALDHLAEIPNYYDLLEEMEKGIEH